MKYYIFLSFFILLSCTISKNEVEKFYVQKNFKGYIVVLYDNYNNSISKKRIYEIPNSGLLVSDLPFKRNSPFDRHIYMYTNNFPDKEKVLKIEEGNKLDICDDCSKNSRKFENTKFLFLDGKKRCKDNLCNEIKLSYEVFLICDKEDIKDLNENSIYSITNQLENYFIENNSNELLKDNLQIQKDIIKLIEKENSKLNI